jgi:hypothetical protein
MSISIWSPSSTSANGPPSIASGETYNTVFVNEEMHASFAFGKTVDGLMICNNIFHLLGNPVDESSREWRRDPADVAIGNVVFRNNLYSRANLFPSSLPIRDARPLIGDPQFAQPGGLKAEDYVPGHVPLIADQGVPIHSLPGDDVGLKVGLEMKEDFFGNPITGKPDLGAVEIKTQ